MKIALFGATGAVGGYFLNKALAAGHEVTALVRSPEKLVAQPNLRAVKGDVTDTSDVQSVINQTDVDDHGKSGGGDTASRRSAIKPAEMSVCQQHRVRRFLLGRFATPSIDQRSRSICRLRTCRCKNRARSKRSLCTDPPRRLKEKPGNGKYRVFQGDGTFARPMAKEDVAAFLFDAVESEKWDGRGGFQLAGCK
jgi:hypothetical protein